MEEPTGLFWVTLILSCVIFLGTVHYTTMYAQGFRATSYRLYREQLSAYNVPHVLLALQYILWMVGYFFGTPFRAIIRSREERWAAEDHTNKTETDALKFIEDMPELVRKRVEQKLGTDPRLRLRKQWMLTSVPHLVKDEFNATKHPIDFPDQPLVKFEQNYKIKYKTNDLVEYVADFMYKVILAHFKQFPAWVNEVGNQFTTQFLSIYSSAKPIDDWFHEFQRPDKMFSSVFLEYLQRWYSCRAAIEGHILKENSKEHMERLIDRGPFSAFIVTMDVTIPKQLRFEGVWVIAPPGRGKTTLLSSLLSSDLQEVIAGKASVILMDSKGDLIDHAKKLKQFEMGGPLEDRLVIIEPHEKLAINPLDLGKDAGHTIALLEYVFASILDTAPTPLQSTLFRSVLLAMQAVPNATFDTFRSFLTDGWRPYENYLHNMHPDDQEFFFKGEFDSDTYKKTKQELLWRIRDLTTKVPLLRDMFKAPYTKLNIGKEMDAGKVIIIDNSAAKLSAGSEFFSRFFVALILAAAQQRAGREDNEKLPCYFYIDECDTVIARDLKIAEIIQRCRSQKIGLVLAHQSLTQIDNEKVKAALADCAVRFANSDDEAAQLAPKLRAEAYQLHSLNRGQFLCFMRDVMKRPIVVDVLNNPVSIWPKMTDEEFEGYQVLMLEKYGYVQEMMKAHIVPQEQSTDPAKWH